MKYVPINDYFSEQLNIDNNIKNGYKYNKIDDFYYLVKGKSISDKNFLFSTGSELIILNSTGDLIEKGSFIEIENFNILNVNQISNILYSGIFSDSNAEFKNNYLGIFYKDYLSNYYKCIEKYKLLDSPLVRDVHLDHHTYIYKKPGHVYLYAQNRDPNIEVIQEQKDGKIIWEYYIDNNSIELTDLKIRTFGTQIAHINCIKELTDNLLLISFRNLGIACLNKSTNKFEWFIGIKKNSLDFKYVPQLQHHLEFLNVKRTKFATFSNNWVQDSAPVEKLIEAKKFPESLVAKLTNCNLITYSLENNDAQLYQLDYLCTPRLGNLVYLKDNIFDINYGFSIIKDEQDKLYNLGIIEEKNLDTNEIYFSLKLPFGLYNIQRGL